MPKSNNRYQLLEDLSSLNPVSVEDQIDFRFNLFLRSREMKQIVFCLEKIMLKKKAEREIFIKENKAIIESLMKVFLDDSNLTLEGMQMDEETAQLSMQLAMDLRKSMALINTLFYGVAGLAS